MKSIFSEKNSLIHNRYFNHFLLTCFLHLALSMFSYHYLCPYGYLSKLQTSQHSLGFLTNFDGYHYLHNEYTHLPNFAFLPGYTTIVRVFVEVFGMWWGIVGLAILNKVLMWFSVNELQKICRALGMDVFQVGRCLLLFIYNPVTVFYHSVYSESLYTFLTFKYVSLSLSSTQCQIDQKNKINREASQINSKNIIKCAALLVLSVSIRSTALFLLPVIGWPILSRFYFSLKERKVKDATFWFLKGSTVLLSTVAVFLSYLSWAYSRVCFGTRKLKQCDRTLFLNVYSYVQKEYWNVGLFTYYDKSNIVFILIGLPSLIFSLLFLLKPKTIPQISLQLSFWILLIVTITMTNLQSSTRFLCSHPAFYINCVAYFTTEANIKEKQRLKKIMEKIFDMWRLGYFYMGIVLFTMEFPWT